MADHEPEQCRPRTCRRRRRIRRRSPRAAGRGKSLTIGAVCKALVAGVPRHLDLQDPLPRGPEAAHAAAHAGRLPAVLRGRRLAPAHDPAPAARRVPAAAGDPPGARGRAHRGREVAQAPAQDGAAGAEAAPGAALRRLTFSIAPARRDVLAGRRRRGHGCRSAARRRARGLRDHPGQARGGTQATTTRRSARSSARSPSWRATASPGATCASSGPLRSGSPCCCSRSSRPALRSRNPERRREAVEALENLAAVASHLKHLLLVRDLRRIAR